MKDKVVQVIDHSGNVIWSSAFMDTKEALEALRVLMKPSMFGVSQFKIVIQTE